MKEIDELGNSLLELKKQTENQKKVISEFETERDHLLKEIQHLDNIVQGIVSTYGEKGDKLFYVVKGEMDSLKDEMKKRLEGIDFNISQFSHRVDSIESRLKLLDSDTDRLASERASIQQEFKIIENIKNDLTELEKWKHRAFERIDEQDAKIDDRMRELGSLEKRMENSLKLLGEKFENVIKDQREYFDGEIEKLSSQMEKIVDIQQSHIDKVEEDIRNMVSSDITPRLLKVDNALEHMKKWNLTFQNIKQKTEKLQQGISTFKSDFKDTENDLKRKMQDNIKRIDEFESRMSGFMNELVQEYEKRFDMIRKDIEKYIHPLQISESLETTGQFKTEGFLNRIKKIFIKEDVEKIEKLENELKRQKILMKKLLTELKSVTETDSK